VEMLKEMERLGFGDNSGSSVPKDAASDHHPATADDAASADKLSNMLLGVMEQLTGKDVLYDPMRELHDKFPAWLAANRDRITADETRRFEDQQTIVGEIVTKFDDPAYHDEDPEAREYITERMRRMQAAGAPPEELVGDMGSAQEAIGELETACPMQ